MSKYISFEFCELPATPHGFDIEKFKLGDPDQLKLYRASKTPNRKKSLTFEQAVEESRNSARVVPEDCMFIDYDDPEEADKMREIIVASGVRCLMMKTTKGYHFLFRKPEFYKKEMTGAKNWFGYNFDTKAGGAVQIICVCGMVREERCSWDLKEVAPSTINTEELDVLPYWLWGKWKDKDLHKGGKPGESEYTLFDTPFTQLMKMKEGGRHDHIFNKCSFFGISNGFLLDEFEKLIQVIHDIFMVKIGSAMSESDLFGDLPTRWTDYEATLTSSGWAWKPEDRVWKKVSTKTTEKIDERRAAEYLFKQYDFYVRDKRADGRYDTLCYREKEGDYNYRLDLPEVRKTLRSHSEQNFRENYHEEVQKQLMQLCVENGKTISRSSQYVICKNKVLSCIMDDAYGFEWLDGRSPTDVVYNWNWKSKEWVDEHEEDLGGLIKKFITDTSRNSMGIPDPLVEKWLYVVAGAAMVPSNRLEKIVVMAGGGSNGKSLFTTLVRLCLGGDMWNEAKIFDSSPQEGFWGATLDMGICCVVDDLPERYNKEAFSYIKGAITKTDTIIINEKFKPKKELLMLPQIICCTNHNFELYDKSEGMKRRVLILPCEYEIDEAGRDYDLPWKLFLNTSDLAEVNKYRMYNDIPAGGRMVNKLNTKEKGVVESLDHGSLCWFANKCRYEYFKWATGATRLESSIGMKEKLDGTFSGGFDENLYDFLRWYIENDGKSIWMKEIYVVYMEWHAEACSGDTLMKEKAFAMRFNKALARCADEGYDIVMKKKLNDKRMSLNYLFINEGAVADDGET